MCGGPAGLEAARVAVTKAHRVTLFEREAVLGGQLNIARIPPRKQKIDRAIQNLEQTVSTVGARLRWWQIATTQSMLDLAPDAVIVAVGATSFTPAIPAVDGQNVCDGWKVLAGDQEVSARVAMIGGGLVGCETAENLASQDCKDSLVEMLEKIDSGISNTVLPTPLENFRRYGVEQFTGYKVTGISARTLHCEDKIDNALHIACDHVVMASDARSVGFDTAALTDKGIVVIKVGDCAEVADISHAIKTAYDAAYAL